MKVIHYFICLISVLSTHHSNASSFLTKPLEKIKQFQKEIKGKNKKTKDLNLCKDFTGIWRGQCGDSLGKIQEVDFFKIKQDTCYAMNFDGIEISVGGLASINNTPSQYIEDYYPVNRSITLIWNDSQTQLTMLSSLNSLHISLIQKHKMWIENDKLIVREIQTNYMALVEFPIEIVAGGECVYERITLGE